MVELKPCPFCGGEIDHVSGGLDVDDKGPYWYIYCGKCGGSQYGDHNKKKVIEAWNRRASE